MPADDARLLADDPRTLFGIAAKMFSTPYPEIQDLQLEALRHPFESLRPQVPLLTLWGAESRPGHPTWDDATARLPA